MRKPSRWCGLPDAGFVLKSQACHAGFVEEILQNTEAPSHGHVVGNFVEGCVACEMLRLAVLESLNGTKVKVVSFYFVVLTVWRAPSKFQNAEEECEEVLLSPSDGSWHPVNEEKTLPRAFASCLTQPRTMVCCE